MTDQDDDWHAWVVRSSREELIVPVAVPPEAAHLPAAHLGAHAERRRVSFCGQR
jgi:hypothetical protein